MKRIDPTPDGQLTFAVHLAPRASRTEVIGWTPTGALKVRVTSPPVDNKANRELVQYLAKALGIAHSEVIMTSGATSRRKRLRVPASCKNRLSSYSDI